MKLGNTELSKKQMIALVAGAVLILGAAGGYWFYGKDLNLFKIASVDEENLEDLEGEESFGEDDLFGDDDLFSEGDGTEDVTDFFDEGTMDENLFDESVDSDVVELSVEEGTEMTVAEIESAKEKGNLIELESTKALTEEEMASLPRGSMKDLLKRENDIERKDVVPALDEKKETATMSQPSAISSNTPSSSMTQEVIVKKKPVMPKTYRIRHGDTFSRIAKRFGYPVSFQAKLAFLEENPSAFNGMTGNNGGDLHLPMRAGQRLTLPKKPFKRSWLYNRSGGNIETYAIEFYESENEASAKVVRDTLVKRGLKAYVRPYGRSFQVLIGFFDSKASAEKVIKDAALYFGRSDDTINLLKLTRGNESTDEYVAREREQYYIEIFSSQSRGKCLDVLDAARAVQVKTSLMVEERLPRELIYRVRVGYFNSRLEAVNEAKFLKQRLFDVNDFFIKKGKMK